MLDPSALETWGMPGLFVAAFLAGSIVPAPSEGVLAALVYSGISPARAVVVATAGNLLGATTLFLLGRWLHDDRRSRLGRWLEARRTAAGPKYQRAVERVRRFGAPALLLSWLPFVGDLLVLAAGVLGIAPLGFLIFTAAGKALRYAAIAWSVTAAL